MAIWKEQTTASKEPPIMPQQPAPAKEEPFASATPTYNPPSRPSMTDQKETLIAANLSIEGKIQGAGHVRVAGQFKGDVNVEGDLTIEKGAKLTGGVKAQKIIIAGELDGNVEMAQRVELLETGVLNGDLKAQSFTVAAGSRMRGSVEFGWDEKTGRKGDEA